MEVKFVDLCPLQKIDEAWFYKEFVQGFMDAYADKTFFIMESEKFPKLLGPINLKEKQKWLFQSAKELFKDYVLSEKENHKAFKIIYNQKLAGAMLYHVYFNNNKSHTLYLHLLFVCAPFQKKGITTYIVEKLLPELHPMCERYELLTRHQNDTALLSYVKLGFQVGDIQLVQRHGCNPLYYIGLYKEK